MKGKELVDLLLDHMEEDLDIIFNGRRFNISSIKDGRIKLDRIPLVAESATNDKQAEKVDLFFQGFVDVAKDYFSPVPDFSYVLIASKHDKENESSYSNYYCSDQFPISLGMVEHTKHLMLKD